LRWLAPGVLLPPELLVKRDQTLGAFMVENGHARFLPAPAAQEGRPFAMALSPETPLVLSPETPLVVRGQQGLTDGQTVTVTDGTR